MSDYATLTRPVILIGASGLGKSTIAQNIAHHVVIHGHTVLFTTASQLLGDLAALDSDSLLRRRLRYYAAPALLVIDEVGNLSYSNRHADLLFELINRRDEQKSTSAFRIDQLNTTDLYTIKYEFCSGDTRLKRVKSQQPDSTLQLSYASPLSF